MLISISIVSHGQMALISDLLADIDYYCSDTSLEVLLTLNINERIETNFAQFAFPILVIKNESPKGFGANHNQAFRLAGGDFFCVLNPDVRLSTNPFPFLCDTLSDPVIGVCAPLVLNSEGGVEDSARRFPTPLSLFKKIIWSKQEEDYKIDREIIFPDWVGGMFMLFRYSTFTELSGFDERYFLYYEDVDLCARLSILGMKVVLVSNTSVIHLAQRASHRNLKYMRWHISSMLRFFLSRNYWRLSWQ